MTHYTLRETPAQRATWTARRDIPPIWFDRAPWALRLLNWLKGVR